MYPGRGRVGFRCNRVQCSRWVRGKLCIHAHSRYVVTLYKCNTGGKLNRGLSVVHTVLAIRGAAITEREARLAAIVGWCIEWMQAFALIADDIMDASITANVASRVLVQAACCWPDRFQRFHHASQ